MRPVRSCLLIAAVLWAAPSATAAQGRSGSGGNGSDLMEYTVRRGDTCAGIARRFYGNARRYDRIHAHNPQLGPPPHHLAPGTVLRLPRPSGRGAAEPDARVTAARRRVRARAPDDAEWHPAQVGLELFGGSQVATGERSSAELAFRDRSELSVREQTLVVIYGGSRRLARRTDARATLERGALRSRLTELAGTLEVDTPGARTRVGGGRAVVAVADDGTSRVSNLGGTDASVTAGRASVRLPAGTGTLVRRGGRPSPPRRLPDPPRWAQDQAGRFVGLTGRGGTLRGRWVRVDGASRYRVEVATQPDGGDVVAATEVPGDAEEFVVHRLPPGTYYVSVATIDGELLEGRPSPRRAMQVLSARIIPPGGARPVEEEYDPGDPSRPFRAPRLLPGTWIVAPVGLRCATTDDPPREMWTVREPGVHAVRCVDAHDREIPAFDVEVVRVTARVVPSNAALVRHHRRELTVALDAPLPLPSRIVASVPPGVTVGVPRRRPDGLWTVALTAGQGAPRELRLELATAAADERVPLASVVVPVRSSTPPEPSQPRPSPPPPSRPPAIGHALPRVPLPEGLSLDDPERRGTRVWLAAAAFDPGGDAWRLRTAAGARAQVLGSALRLGFSWSFDAIAPSGPDGGGRGGPVGAGDVRASAAWAVAPASRVHAVLQLDGWLPTSIDPAGLEHAALLPSISFAWTVSDRITLRARQGLGVSLAGDATAAWASATGVDLQPARWLSVRAEIDATVGTAGDQELRVVAPAAGLAVSLGWLEAAAALRWPLGGGHRRVFGDPSIVMSAAVAVP